MADKKYYWLKLHKDFFKRHDIRIIEDMENGKDYILFYLKLLLESVSHEGNLRFSETIPYNEKMLATITNTNIDIVRAAMKVFQELRMIDVLEDETIFMNEVEAMIGCETEWAKKKREYRLSIKDNVRTKKDIVRQEIEKEIEIEKELEIDKEKHTKRKPLPVVHYPDDPKLDEAFKAFIKMRKDMKKPLSDRALSMAKNKLEKLSGGDHELAIKIIDQSIFRNWQDLYELKTDQKKEPEKSDWLKMWEEA